jgi:hypothetical protein
MDVPRLGCLGVKYGNSVTRANRDSLGRASLARSVYAKSPRTATRSPMLDFSG